MREFSPDSPLGNPHRSWQVIASIGAGLMAMLSMWFFIDDALPYFAVTEESYGRFWHRTGWLLSHVVGGSIALLSGPVQLWSGISRRHLTLHRWSGRLYVLGAALGAITALQLAFNTESWTFGVALFVGGVIWQAVIGSSEWAWGYSPSLPNDVGQANSATSRAWATHLPRYVGARCFLRRRAMAMRPEWTRLSLFVQLQ